MEFNSTRIGDNPIGYEEAWEWQRALHAKRVDDQIEDTILLLEHPAVYTARKRTEPHERPQDGTPVVDVDRGGKITFHGPGQLVGYPITKLPSHVLVVDYVRRLEEALIRALEEFGLNTGRVPGRSGVWFAASVRDRRRRRDQPERRTRPRRAGGRTPRTGVSPPDAFADVGGLFAQPRHRTAGPSDHRGSGRLGRLWCRRCASWARA